MLGSTLAASLSVASRTPAHLERPLRQISSAMAGWTSLRDLRLDDRTVRVLGATEYLSRLYAKDGDQLDFFVAYYAQQRAGESIHSPKHCLPGAGWEIWRHGAEEFTIDGSQYRINNYGIQNSGQRRVMLYWYQSPERVLASEYLGKLMLARDTLMTGRTAGSMVRIILPDKENAVLQGVSFAREAIPEMQRCLGR